MITGIFSDREGAGYLFQAEGRAWVKKVIHYKGMLVLHENFLQLERRVVLPGSSEKKGWDWRESPNIGKHFECHLEEFKSDVVGERLFFSPPTPPVLYSLECIKPLMSFIYFYFKIPIVGELLSSWPFCKAATLFPPPQLWHLARCWLITLPGDEVQHTVGVQ